MQPPLKKRVRLRTALAAMRRLTINPEDTAQFALALESLEGDSPRRLFYRMQKSAEGRDLLEREPDIVARLSDREALARLPTGSLGRAYLEFVEREHKSSEQLIDVIEAGRRQAYAGDEVATEHFVSTWMRDTHDLYHLVTGYGTDLIGEMCVLVFSSTQTGNLGVMVPVLFGAPRLLRNRPDALRMAIKAGRRARHARFFPVQDWPRLLERPLAEIRTELRVGAPQAYEPLHFSELSQLRAATG